MCFYKDPETPGVFIFRILTKGSSNFIWVDGGWSHLLEVEFSQPDIDRSLENHKVSMRVIWEKWDGA